MASAAHEVCLAARIHDQDGVGSSYALDLALFAFRACFVDFVGGWCGFVFVTLDQLRAVETALMVKAAARSARKWRC